MQKWIKISIIPFLVLLLFAGAAMADNITIFDGLRDETSLNNWWNTTNENDEVEPGMVYTQRWDLEAFLLDGNILSMGGGFDFMDLGSQYGNYTSGDIFIEVDTIADGYDYVIDVNWGSGGYDVYALDKNSGITPVFLSQNASSSPWKYDDVNDKTGVLEGHGFFENNTGSYGFDYYVTGFDLSFLGFDQDFIAHFTMGCGNDNLMGKGTTAPVPEPATMLLLGTGLIGLAGVGRRKLFKK